MDISPEPFFASPNNTASRKHSTEKLDNGYVKDIEQCKTLY
jgi:hypothetical protein